MKAPIQNKSKTNTQKRILIILSAVILVLIGVFLSIDLPSRTRFAQVSAELQKVDETTMKSAGAEERLGSGYPQKNGDGLLNSLNCYPDVHCPAMTRQWFVPIEPGKEQEFVESTLKTQNYYVDTVSCNLKLSSYCDVNGGKDGFKASASILPSSYEGSAKPVRDVSPRAWRLVSVTVALY